MTNLVLTGADKQHDKTSSRWLTYLCTIAPFRRCILSSISIIKKLSIITEHVIKLINIQTYIYFIVLLFFVVAFLLLQSN